MAPALLDAPNTLPWKTFLAGFRWQQGEHITALGANGSGKSTLLLALVKNEPHVVLLLTKPRDPTLETFIKQNDFKRLYSWPPSYDDNRIALWPRFRSVEDYSTMGNTFYRAINGYKENKQRIDGIFQQGGWVLVADEMRVMQRLGLEDTMVMLLTQGRSNDLSIVCGAQRPRHVPVEMLSEPTHLFLYHCSDKYDIDRLSDIGGRRTEEIKQIVPMLEQYQFLYVNKRNGTLAISKVDKKR
jgi:energy-coupling factor transporter ATP-binding protein EcfA2